jgi:hypothetical protein
MKKAFTGFLLAITVLILAWFWDSPSTKQAERDALTFATDEPVFLYGIPVDDKIIVEEKIKKNQLLGEILIEYNVPAKLVHQLSVLPKNVFDVRKVAPDKKYTLICEKDSLLRATAMVYEPNPIDYVILKFQDSLVVDVCQRDITIVEKGVSGVIRSSRVNQQVCRYFWLAGRFSAFT